MFTWIPIYTELATVLLTYRSDRSALIQRLQSAYDSISMKLPTLDSTPAPTDIDPFTVFGLFNKGLSDANRIAIIEALKTELDLSSPVPSNFDGIPVLNNLSATFYRFANDSARGEHDIDNLWAMHEAALAYADNNTADNRAAFVEAYDTVRTQKGIRWNLTMALYWIRPYAYINLDSRNRWYMSNEKYVPQSIVDVVTALKEAVPDGETYLHICDVCHAATDSFPALSFSAWTESERVNNEAPPPDSRGDADVETTKYWLYAPGKGAAKWEEYYSAGIMGLGWSELGDPRDYTTKAEMSEALRAQLGGDSSYSNSVLAVWQFVHEVKPGDIIFVKKGMHEILGRGVVESDYEYDPNIDDHPNIRHVKWTHKGNWKSDETLAMKTLTDLSNYTGTVEKIKALMESPEEDTDDPPAIAYPPYTKDDFLKDVYISPTEYESIVGELRYKKNLILQGAPGVGKTFAAKRIAYSIMGEKDINRVAMVQFHQSYSYEDFIMGYRPTATGFILQHGVFYDFCKRAEEDDERDYFFIIDELNRGNLSKIFGELFVLLDCNQRGPKNRIKLLYEDEYFFVPNNVYVIAMMNTADRSLAMMDVALRRRFGFYDMQPALESHGFKEYQQSLGNTKFDRLIDVVKDLNEAISTDDSLGQGYRIGHSFFCNLTPESVTDHRLKSIVNYELIPTIEEYWCDDPKTAAEWTDRLRGAIK